VTDKPSAREETVAPPPEPPELLRTQVPAEIRNVSFPVAVRGYDRRAVEAYIHRVNRVIAELEVSRSPQAAVRHAVERVSEQTKGILQQARESAEQITATAREEAEQIVAAAKARAADLVVNADAHADGVKAEAEQALAEARAEADQVLAHAQAEAAEHQRQTKAEIAALQEEAEARMRELQADTEAVWEERRRLLGDIHGMADRLQEAAATAAARFPPQEPELAEETPEKAESRAEDAATVIASRRRKAKA